MPAALSAPGPTFPLQGGSHHATLSTIMPVGGRYHHGLLIHVMPRNRGAAAPLRSQGRRRIETTMTSSESWSVPEAGYSSADVHTVAGTHQPTLSTRMPPMPTRPPPGASPSDAHVPQTHARGATMPAALSASGSTFPLQGGSHQATLSTIIPPRPTRPPPGAPLPESLRSGLSQSDVILVRRDLGRSILQKSNHPLRKIQLKLLESFLEVSWQPGALKEDLGRLWIGIRSKGFFVLEGRAEVFCWPMHLTLFRADNVRCPGPSLREWMEIMTHNTLAESWFIAAGEDFTQLPYNYGCRVILLSACCIPLAQSVPETSSRSSQPGLGRSSQRNFLHPILISRFPSQLGLMRLRVLNAGELPHMR